MQIQDAGRHLPPFIRSPSGSEAKNLKTRALAALMPNIKTPKAASTLASTLIIVGEFDEIRYWKRNPTTAIPANERRRSSATNDR